MSNTKKATPIRQAPRGKAYKFATMKREADKRRADREDVPEVEPFVIDDVEPPIRITMPDTLERKLIVSDSFGAWKSGQWNTSGTIPLLQALCGDEFGRVWMMIKDDPDELVMLELIQAMFDHFASVLTDVTGAADLPGGSEDSLN
jgi:hypothetical protein